MLRKILNSSSRKCRREIKNDGEMLLILLPAFKKVSISMDFFFSQLVNDVCLLLVRDGSDDLILNQTVKFTTHARKAGSG